MERPIESEDVRMGKGSFASLTQSSGNLAPRSCFSSERFLAGPQGQGTEGHVLAAVGERPEAGAAIPTWPMWREQCCLHLGQGWGVGLG